LLIWASHRDAFFLSTLSAERKNESPLCGLRASNDPRVAWRVGGKHIIHIMEVVLYIASANANTSMLIVTIT
jgi:hypothetical protein